MDYYRFESIKKRKIECDYCNQNEKKSEYHSQTLTYYRNKASDNYYFCSNDCKNRFNNEKKCNNCNFHSDLMQPPGETFVLCTNYPFEKSCYEKYMFNKYGQCSFCKQQPQNELKINETTTINYCNKCCEIYKNIVLTLDYEIEQTLNDIDNNCVFCNQDNVKNIKGFTICDECVNNYKLLAFGCNQ